MFLDTSDVVRDVEKPSLLKKLSQKMSAKIENVVYRAS